MESENPTSELRRRSRVEVGLFAAIPAAGLLGFMSSLSTGDVQEAVGGEDSKTATYTQQ
jgi:hypothetical protein